MEVLAVTLNRNWPTCSPMGQKKIQPEVASLSLNFVLSSKGNLVTSELVKFMKHIVLDRAVAFLPVERHARPI
jgi:hypothetical protein